MNPEPIIEITPSLIYEPNEEEKKDNELLFNKIHQLHELYDLRYKLMKTINFFMAIEYIIAILSIIVVLYVLCQ